LVRDTALITAIEVIDAPPEAKPARVSRTDRSTLLTDAANK
jgi:hypothetical protein